MNAELVVGQSNLSKAIFMTLFMKIIFVIKSKDSVLCILRDDPELICITYVPSNFVRDLLPKFM